MVDLPPGISFDESVKSVAAVEQDTARDARSAPGVHAPSAFNGQMRKSLLRVQTTRKDERDAEAGGHQERCRGPS